MDRRSATTRILTMDYAAPEMYSTQARFGPYTDLFCLGGTLYHALTGRLPPAVMDRLQEAGLDFDFPDAVSDRLVAAIRQALQIAVADRPQSTADFKTGLCGDYGTAGQTTSVPLDGKVERPAKPYPSYMLHGHMRVGIAHGQSHGLSHILHGHTGGVRGMDFSPDGRTLASFGGDWRTVRLWDVTTGKLRHTFKVQGSNFYSSAFSPDSRILAIGASDSSLRLWDVVTGELRRTLSHRDSVYRVVFSPDGQRLACGGKDGAVYLWDKAAFEASHHP